MILPDRRRSRPYGRPGQVIQYDPRGRRNAGRRRLQRDRPRRPPGQVTTFFSAADAAPGAGAFTCTFSAPNIDCTGGTILAEHRLAGSTSSRRPDASRPDRDRPGRIQQTLTNSAFVDPYNAIVEGDETNNVAVRQDPGPVEDQPEDRARTDPDRPARTSTADYDITVTNEIRVGRRPDRARRPGRRPLPVGLIPLSSVDGRAT